MSGSVSGPKLSLRQKLRQSLKSSTTSASTTSVPSTTGSSVINQSPNAGSSLLDQALQRLLPSDRLVLQQHLSSSTDITLAIEQAFKAATDKRKECQDKRWTCRIGGKDVVLRDKADKLAKWLDRFKMVGDVAVNADPIHAGLPWAGIRLLLEVAVADSNQMASLIVGCEAILFTATRLRTYVEFMQTLPSVPVRKNLEDSIVLLYGHLLLFLSRAIQIYQKSTIQRIFSAFGKIDEIVDFEEKANEIAAQIERDASACDRIVDAQVRVQLQQNLNDLQQLRLIQTSLDQLHLKIDLAKIPYAKGALLNSKDGVHNVCHPATRIDLLAEIQQWAQSSTSKSIFWLQGAAGTGKSTISWTFAQWLGNRLGASFFFKRGEGDRGTASLFFPTIIRQLVTKVPGLDVLVAKAVESEPFVFDKNLGEQFRVLLLEPFQQLSQAPPLIVVVDALDECENDRDIQTLLELWIHLAQFQTGLRFFLTSRPDPPIRLKFWQTLNDIFDNVVLQDAVPQTTIEHDIHIYLKDSFEDIVRVHNSDLPTDLHLDNTWPGEQKVMELVQQAVPLFIVAATVQRFVGDPDFDPVERLEEFLAVRSTGAQMEFTYLPVLKHLMAKSDEKDRMKLCEDFRTIIGTVICLIEPLSIKNLSTLLEKSPKLISQRLAPLHSVLRIPDDSESPVRTLHLSFAEFLFSLDPNERPFAIDASATHLLLMKQCLKLLSRTLRENICDLEYPGIFRDEIDPDLIANRISPVMEYACRNWIKHLDQTNEIPDEVYVFLKEHFLHWIEALTLLGRMSEAVDLVFKLNAIVDKSERNAGLLDLHSFAEDAQRFVLAYRYNVNQAPLQLYLSASIFVPQKSIIRNICGKVLEWLVEFPTPQATWGPEFFTLEGHKDTISDISFSADGSLIASGGDDTTVRLWDARSGEEIQRFTGHTGSVLRIAFSPTNTLLVSASFEPNDHIRVWDYITGLMVWQIYNTPLFRDLRYCYLGFSPDGRTLVIANDEGLRIFDMETRENAMPIEGSFSDIAFSPLGTHLAVAFHERKLHKCAIHVWEWPLNQEMKKLTSCGCGSLKLNFTPDGSKLACICDVHSLRLLSVASGQVLHTSDSEAWTDVATDTYEDLTFFGAQGRLLICNDRRIEPTAVITALKQSAGPIAMSPDHSILALCVASSGGHVWNVWSEKPLDDDSEEMVDYLYPVFSPDGYIFASRIGNNSICLKDMGGDDVHIVTDKKIREFTVSNNLLAVMLYDGDTLLWDNLTDLHGKTCKSLLELIMEPKVHVAHSDRCPVALSPDGKLLASVNGLYESSSGKILMFEENLGNASILRFSPDSSILCSIEDGDFATIVTFWDTKTGCKFWNMKSEIHKYGTDGLAISPDNSLLVMLSYPGVLTFVEVTTKSILQRVKAYVSTNENFQVTTERLVTRNGTLRITDLGLSSCRIEPDGIYLEGSWIMNGDRRMIRLPHNYKGPSFFKNGRLGIMPRFGKMGFYRFKDRLKS